MNSIFFLLVKIFAAAALVAAQSNVAGDKMTVNSSLSDGQTLVSPGRLFALGFFSPGSTKNRYLAIWYYNIPIQTPIWIANRATPINTSKGMLNFTADGNLVLSDGNRNIVWSTGTSNVTNPLLQVLDSGNLELNGGTNNTVVWESFDYLSDTYIVGMKLGVDIRHNYKRYLTSWKSAGDPSPGAYSFQLEMRSIPELYVESSSRIIFRTGLWNGHGFDGNPLNSNGMFQTNYISDENETYYTSSTVYNSLAARIVMNSTGYIEALVWSEASSAWSLFESIPTDPCDNYAACGANGICNYTTSLGCQCVPGFYPVDPENWDKNKYSSGCVQEKALNCSTDMFWKIQNVKLPDTVNATVDSQKNLTECQSWCTKNCSCAAYAVIGGIGCITWTGDFFDLRFFPKDASDLYVRLAQSAFEPASAQNQQKQRMLKIVLPTTIVIVALILICSLGILLWYMRKRNEEKKKSQDENILFTLSTDLAIDHGENDTEAGFSLFQFSDIVNATEKFSHENKIGEGGFGPVYKGKLPDGLEVAVKRLSAQSGQGLLEFKNEIVVIAKLQHRNLVKLLGCSIQGEEKILVYEFLPNKSLDHFLFDSTKGAFLDWQKRLNIIEGIAQGLLYLHKHSRLQIIHRDLKASNILLDSDMNPKISDFGMARIFCGNEAQRNTNRVVGTYGYMPPEYASEGLFSFKSDVFSFGVLLLEIISGKRNAGFHQYGNFLNLLGYAWQLWNDGEWRKLVDPSLDDVYTTNEVSRCILVALMCVQENARDRPTMSEVINMLSNANATIPEPRRPAFFTMRVGTDSESHSGLVRYFSMNDVTITAIEGR